MPAKRIRPMAACRSGPHRAGPIARNGDRWKLYWKAWSCCDLTVKFAWVGERKNLRRIELGSALDLAKTGRIDPLPSTCGQIVKPHQSGNQAVFVEFENAAWRACSITDLFSRQCGRAAGSFPKLTKRVSENGIMEARLGTANKLIPATKPSFGSMKARLTEALLRLH